MMMTPTEIVGFMIEFPRAKLMDMKEADFGYCNIWNFTALHLCKPCHESTSLETLQA